MCHFVYAIKPKTFVHSSPFMEHTEDCEDTSLCGDILLNHVNTIYQPTSENEDVHRINVRRSNLFDDTVTQFKKTTLDFTKIIEVRFCGEPAADAGGPKRELFRLFIHELCHKANGLFQSSSKGLIPTHNILAVQRKDYYTIGRIVAASILLVGCPPKCFAPVISDFLVYGEVRMNVLDEGVYCILNEEIRPKLQEVK